MAICLVVSSYVPAGVDLVGVPTLHGAAARRELLLRYGLPNAAPRPGENLFTTTRELFVDDDADGAPVAYWTARA